MTIKVVNTTVNGRNFWFSTADWDEIVGNTYWNLKVFVIEQSRSKNWNGTVTVTRTGNANSFGLRSQGSDSNQWAINDIIYFRGKCV